MHIAVLGGGVVGVTTAYYLTRAGHRVTLIEAQDALARGASHANGGQLAYSFTEALGSPGFLRSLPGLLLGRDPAIRIGPRPGPGFLGWGLAFVRECSRARAHANSAAAIRMARRSAALLGELRERVPLRFSFRRAGKLVLLCDEHEYAAAEAGCELKRDNGCSVQMLDMQAAWRIEPALEGLGRDFRGAVYAEGDEVADARLFTQALARWLVDNAPLTLAMGTRVEGLDVAANRVRAVRTDRGAVDADAAVVCLGAQSPRLLAPHGIRARICPVRGYSVTLPPGEHAPRVSLTDLARRVVFSRLDGRLRIAGFADFVGFRRDGDERRIRDLLAAAAATAPRAAVYDAASTAPWAGCRPMTPDGRPLIGATRVEGLFLNTGHGALGWTLACASGHDVAQAIGGAT